jgi:DNA processing protein
VDVLYPWENRHLAEKIIENGAVLSEFSLGKQPEAGNFPARNRIISGLSLGVVVMEASYRSGSLITARLALEQGREVFAVPGNVDAPSSKGTNRLIKEGAKVVTNLDDIIEEIVPQWKTVAPGEEIAGPSVPTEDVGTEGIKVLELLERSPMHIDELIQRSGFSSSALAGVLLDLELRGFVTQLPGKLFKRL